VNFTPVADKDAGMYGFRVGKKDFVGVVARNKRASAEDQLASAQSRAKAARERAQARMAGRRRGTPGSDFHVLNGGLVGAVALFMLAVIGAGAMLFLIQRKPVRVVRTTLPDGQSVISIDLPGFDVKAPMAPIPPIPPVDVSAEHNGSRVFISNPGHPRPKVVINTPGHSTQFSIPAAEEELPASVKGHRVLVVSDIQPMTPAVNGTLDRLRAAGFTLLGNLPGEHLDDETRAEQEELEASVKMARALGQLDSSDVSSHISHWITEQEGINLVVWFARNEDQTRERCYIFPPALDSDSSKIEQLTRDSDLAAAEHMVSTLGH
jgi:hypothetical protein